MKHPYGLGLRYFTGYILLSPQVFLCLSPEAPQFSKNNNFEYIHQILGGNNTEPINSENQNYMQIINSFAYFFISLAVYLLYNVLNPTLTKQMKLSSSYR